MGKAKLRCILLIGGLVTSIFVLSAGAADPSLADYGASIDEWHRARIDRLTSDTGYLNLAGLYWLEEGRNTFGADPGNDIVFPQGKAAPVIGSFEVRDGQVAMSISEGVEVLSGDAAVTELVMQNDLSGEPTVARHRKLAWFIIERDGRPAVRLRDSENPAIARFRGIERYPVDPLKRVRAVLRLFAEPRKNRWDTVIEGLPYSPESPGVLEFELEGKRHKLTPVSSGDRLFIIFADQTSGRETYGAGRFLYADMPGEDGVTILDFNKAYNPPCAFNEFSTCPIAPFENRLPVAIKAGEKFSSDLYSG